VYKTYIEKPFTKYSYKNEFLPQESKYRLLVLQNLHEMKHTTNIVFKRRDIVNDGMCGVENFVIHIFLN